MSARRVVLLLRWVVIVAGCGTEPDVLLITVDTLRPDHLGLYGYERATSPELDRLFADGAVFERAYSAAASTPPSVVSLLTGKLPDEHGVRLFYQLARPDLGLLPELLPETYRTAAFVSSFALTDEAVGLARGFDHYDDFVDERESSRTIYERRAGRTTDAALAWLAANPRTGQPVFVWVHYIDPHGPYKAPQEGGRSFVHGDPQPLDPERVPGFMRVPGVTDARYYVDRYDEEISYVDREIGRLLGGYASRRPLESALTVFTADHGESLVDHEEWFRHSHHVFDEVVRVPLALRGPGVAPGRFEAPVSLIDVAPTILRFVGAAVPDGLAGRDLRDGASVPRDRVLFTEVVKPPIQWRAVVEGRKKWMVRLDAGLREVRARRHYDLASDPGELRSLPWSTAEEAPTRLLERVATDRDPGGLPRDFERGVRLRAPKVDPRARPEDLERLRSLGYVE